MLRALAGFLPELYGGVSANATSESMQVPTRYWAGGLSAVLSVFNGFDPQCLPRGQSVAAGGVSGAGRPSLDTMVSTVEALQNWQRSFEQRDVASVAGCRADYQETQATLSGRSGDLSEVLDKLAALESARVQGVAADYACALAEIVLRDAMGVGLDETRVMEKDEAEAFRKEGLTEGLFKERK